MFARSTTVFAEPSDLDRGISYARDEVLPTLMDIEGCVGMSMLVDRHTGRCISTSAWDSQERMWASEDLVAPVREQLLDVFGGLEPTVQEWEVAMLHRDHPVPEEACARVTWVEIDPDTADDAIESVKLITPTVSSFPGFCSVSLMVNRDTGLAASTTSYDTRDAMVRTRAQGDGLRARVAEATDAEVLEVAEFELVLAHLHVPELV